MRALLFAAVGALQLLYWVLADPSYEASDTQDQWPYVLGFSLVIAALGAALLLLAQLVASIRVFCVAVVVAVAAVSASAANIVEDGLGRGWGFYWFVLSSAVMLIGLVVLVVTIAVVGRGDERLLALVPAGTCLGIVLYVPAGGPIMLVTWLGAAGLALFVAAPSRARLALRA